MASSSRSSLGAVRVNAGDRLVDGHAGAGQDLGHDPGLGDEQSDEEVLGADPAVPEVLAGAGPRPRPRVHLSCSARTPLLPLPPRAWPGVLLVDGLLAHPEHQGHLLPRPALPPGIVDLDGLQPLEKPAQRLHRSQSDQGVGTPGVGGEVGPGAGRAAQPTGSASIEAACREEQAATWRSQARQEAEPSAATSPVASRAPSAALTLAARTPDRANTRSVARPGRSGWGGGLRSGRAGSALGRVRRQHLPFLRGGGAIVVHREAHRVLLACRSDEALEVVDSCRVGDAANGVHQQ